MEKKYVTIHGIELALGSEIVNLTVESLDGDITDVSKLVPGRIYFDKKEGRLKYVDADSTTIRPLANVHQVNDQLVLEAQAREELKTYLEGKIDTLDSTVQDLAAHAIRNDVTSTQKILGNLQVNGDVITSNVLLLGMDSTAQPGIGVVTADNKKLVFLKYDVSTGKLKVIAYYDEVAQDQVYDEIATKKDIQTLNAVIDRITAELSAIETHLTHLDSTVASLFTEIDNLKNIASVYTFDATAASTSYTINHGLNTYFIEVQIQAFDSNSNTQKNDVVPVEIIDTNNIKVSLSTAKLIKAIVRKAG